MKKLIVMSVTVLFCGLSVVNCFSADVSGEYSFKKKNSGGFLTIKSIDGGKANFQFNNSAGSNMGELEFTAPLDTTGNAVYANKTEYDDCQIKLNIKGNVVKVNQLSGNCGAGVGVEFSGIYKKKSGKK